jgi:predicted transcriptional regulator
MVSDKFEEDEAVQAILGILREAGEPLTTREVVEEMQKLQLRCPDSTIVFLNRLRRKDLIQGMRSKERRGWIWWID